MEQQTLFELPAVQQKQASKTLGTGKYWLIKSLLNGCFIMERGGKSKRYEHCLFDLDRMPIKKISRQQWKKVRIYTREKKTKYGPMYLVNLKEIRALSGRFMFKKLYKQNRISLKKQSEKKDETEAI